MTSDLKLTLHQALLLQRAAAYCLADYDDCEDELLPQAEALEQVARKLQNHNVGKENRYTYAELCEIETVLDHVLGEIDDEAPWLVDDAAILVENEAELRAITIVVHIAASAISPLNQP